MEKIAVAGAGPVPSKRMDQVVQRPKKKINKATVVNVAKVYPNDPCPCGQTKVLSFPAGSGLPDQEKPVKFKHCYMNEKGAQSGFVPSTEAFINQRNKLRFAAPQKPSLSES